MPIDIRQIGMGTGKLLGRFSSSTGPVEEITLGSGLQLAGGVLSATATGGGTSWGDITGLISEQSDLASVLNAKANASLIGANNGIATLDSGGKVPVLQLPGIAITSRFEVDSQAAQLALSAEEGDIAIRSDIRGSFVHNGGTSGTMADWSQLLTPFDTITSVNGQTGVVSLNKSHIGLSNVDNTSDADKPISTAAMDMFISFGDSIASLSPVVVGLTTSAIPFVINGGGANITTGVKGDLYIPFGCIVTGWTLLGDQVGSIVVDVYRDAYAAYPATSDDSITGSAKPTISGSTKAQSTTLTGWSTTIAAGSVLRFNVNSVTALQRCSIILHVTRT